MQEAGRTLDEIRRALGQMRHRRTTVRLVHEEPLLPRALPPSSVGISTRSTGGGKYEPDDIRFQTLYKLLSVSNSLSGRDRQLDEFPAVANPAHVAQVGRRYRVFINESQRRVALQ